MTRSARGVGKLAEAYTGTAAKKDYRRTHAYDTQSRPALTTQLLTDISYTSLPEYDAWGRVIRQSYQRGGGAVKVFDSRYGSTGYLTQVQRGTLVLWAVVGQDAANRPVNIRLGNGLTQTRIYNNYTGRLTGGLLATATNLRRLEEGYQYDVLGSVTHRDQHWGGTNAAKDAIGFLEDFTYDALSRLKTSAVMGRDMQTFQYDDIGNIVGKPGVGNGNYVYPDAGARWPHAVKSIAGLGAGKEDFSYDDNGNLIRGGGRSISWTSFDMPKQMVKGALEIECSKFASGAVGSCFQYGPEHQRLRQLRSDASVVSYAGVQEVDIKGGQVTVKTYWPNGIGVEIDRPKVAAPELSWTHVDRLGSPMGLTDQ